MLRIVFLFVFTCLCHAQVVAPGQRDPLKVHDPSTILAENGVYRFFATGMGVNVICEQKNGDWTKETSLFALESLPSWHRDVVPENRGHLWAPDIIKRGEEYFVYYSVSTFGKNLSAIGLAVGTTLDPKSPAWKWQDRGPVILSQKESRYNAIDPAIYFHEKDQRMWMTYGSFWDGIFLIELDPYTGLRKNTKTAPIRLADADQIEAPFLCFHHNAFYLFVNTGLCCRGVESTYEIRVGRSTTIEGPYLDAEGKDMRDGGGSLVLGSSGKFIGPGHASILVREGKEFLVHHYYDAENQGNSRLRMLSMTWNDAQWPVVDTGAAPVRNK